MAFTNKQRVFISEYLRDFNATQAAIRAGYSAKTAYAIGQENLKKPEIADEIKRRVDELTMGAEEMLIGLTDHARANVSDYFRVVEEWTQWPLPTQEVIGAEDRVINEETGEKRTFFWVRHVVLDLDMLTDPRFGRLVKKFSDSPKNGTMVELYDKHSAYQMIAKLKGLLIDKTEITGADGGVIRVSLAGDDD